MVAFWFTFAYFVVGFGVLLCVGGPCSTLVWMETPCWKHRAAIVTMWPLLIAWMYL